MSGWRQKVFAGETRYQLEQIEGKQLLTALSEHSASAFFLEKKVDLTQTPILNWSWRIEQRLNPGDEETRAGDDFAARVYVIKNGGIFFWKTTAINYVWSYQHNKGDIWNNPFAGAAARMFSIRDTMDKLQHLYAEKRNIREDFKQLHGLDITSVDGIAIMTDSDNSGQRALAMYGDIYFSAD